jgi:hypothetical protein
MDIKLEHEPEPERWVLGKIQKFCPYPGLMSDDRIAVRSYHTPERYLEFFPKKMIACIIDYHGYSFGTGLFEKEPRQQLIRKIKIKKIEGGLITLEHPVTL